MVDLFNVSIFLLGVMGSFWTTVCAVMEYCWERIDMLDHKIPDIMFRDVLPSYVTPLIRNKLRRSMTTEPTRLIDAKDAYAMLGGTTVLSLDELEGFKRHSMTMIVLDVPWWLPVSHVRSVVDELAGQYVWFASKDQLDQALVED